MQEMQEIQVQSLGLEDSPGGGNGHVLQFSCLENPTDRGAWWATVHGVAKSQTRLSTHTHAHNLLCEEEKTYAAGSAATCGSNCSFRLVQ